MADKDIKLYIPDSQSAGFLGRLHGKVVGQRPINVGNKRANRVSVLADIRFDTDTGALSVSVDLSKNNVSDDIVALQRFLAKSPADTMRKVNIHANPRAKELFNAEFTLGGVRFEDSNADIASRAQSMISVRYYAKPKTLVSTSSTLMRAVIGMKTAFRCALTTEGLLACGSKPVLVFGFSREHTTGRVPAHPALGGMWREGYMHRVGHTVLEGWMLDSDAGRDTVIYADERCTEELMPVMPSLDSYIVLPATGELLHEIRNLAYDHLAAASLDVTRFISAHLNAALNVKEG